MRTLTLTTIDADAQEINKLHKEILSGLRTTAKQAIRVGKLLTERKKKCQHGKWLPWLTANVQFSFKTADNYRAIYEHRAKFVNVTNLTDALRLINTVKVTEKAKAPKNKLKPQPVGRNVTILQGDCRDVLSTLEAESVQCCISSPPWFNLRDYGSAKWEGGSPECDHVKSYNLKRDHSGNVFFSTRGTQNYTKESAVYYRNVCKKCGARCIHDHQLGLEETPEQYVEVLVEVFKQIKRVLKPDGVVFLNIGSTYGSDKNLICTPWLTGLALQRDGWFLRNDVIINKSSIMPSSCEDRFTMSHEYVLLLTKDQDYYFDYESVMEPADPKYADRYKHPMPGYNPATVARPNGKADTQGGMIKFQEMRRMRTVWSLPTMGYPGHPAAFSERLAEICVLAGSRVGDTTLDPFSGSGTVAAVSQKLERNSIAIELVPEYVALIEERCNAVRAGPTVSAELAA